MLVNHNSFISNYIYHPLRKITLVLVCWGSLGAALARGAELKQVTLANWDAYVDASRLQIGPQTPFLRLDRKPERLQHVRAGEILVSPAGNENPRPVDSGLIHDWIGAAFLPDAKVENVLTTVRDYGNYREYYKPTVVDSRLLSRSGNCEKYSMRVVNKEVVGETALDMEYETCYFKVDENRWYSITQSTRVQELRHYGQANEQELPPDQGSGFIWRLYSIARYEQRDGGTYIEVEAIALSRDIPAALRWMVNPIVRRVSKNSMVLSLQQTGAAVRLTEAANQARKSSTADVRSRGTTTSEARTEQSIFR
jgi:hypothetical protein